MTNDYETPEGACNSFRAMLSGLEHMEADLHLVGSLEGGDGEAVGRWLEAGGMLVRFAGPRLAQNADALLPVRLRGGGRALGGALTWTQPARLAPFDDESPFHGLAIPDDVRVNRQVLAEPSLELDGKTWARTPDSQVFLHQGPWSER